MGTVEKKRKLKKLMCNITVVAMMLSVLNIPMLGWVEPAKAESANTEGYELYVERYDSDTDEFVETKVEPDESGNVNYTWDKLWGEPNIEYATTNWFKIYAEDGNQFPVAEDDGNYEYAWSAGKLTVISDNEKVVKYEEETEFAYVSSTEAGKEYIEVPLTYYGPGTAKVTCTYTPGLEVADGPEDDEYFVADTSKDPVVFSFNITVKKLDLDYKLSVYDDEEYNEEGEYYGDYVAIGEDGIKIDDYYGMMLEYLDYSEGEVPYDHFEISCEDPEGRVDEPYIPNGTIKVTSSNENVAIIGGEFYDEEEGREEIVTGKEVEFNVEYNYSKYFYVYYKGAGETEITVVNETSAGTEEVGSFKVTVDSLGPDFAIAKYDEDSDDYKKIDNFTLNWHDFSDEDGESYVSEWFHVFDFNHKDQWNIGETTWSCNNEDVRIEVDENYTTNEACVSFDGSIIGTPEEPIIITATHIDPLGDEYTSTLTVNVVDYGIRATSYYDEEWEDWYHADDETYTDTDSNLYLGVFNSKDELYENVEWISADEDVVKIGRKGRVYPMGTGQTDVTAKISTESGKILEKNIKITVYDPDLKGKLKYVLNKDDKTAAVYGAKSRWDGKIPETVTIKGIDYTVTSIMDRFDFWVYDGPITVTIPETVTAGAEALRGIYDISSIVVVKANTTYDSYYGSLYTEGKKKLLVYPEGKENSSFTIPSGVVDVADYAISNEYLSKVYVPDTMTLENSSEDALYGNNARYYIGPKNVKALSHAEYYGHDYDINVEQISNFKAATTGTTSLKLSWSKPEEPGITGYYIYRYKNGGYTHIKTIKDPSTTSYTITGLSSGTGYKFRVRAYCSFASEYEDCTITKSSISSGATLAAPTKPTKATLSSLTTGSKYIKANWYKRTGSGYYVYVATNSSFTKDLKKYKITSSSTLNKKVTGLTKGKTYYVKVRAYKTYEGKTVYGDWSSKKSIKCK